MTCDVNQYCTKPGYRLARECLTDIGNYDAADACLCSCHTVDPVDAKDTEILSLRSRLVDSEFMLALVLEAVRSNEDVDQVLRLARGPDDVWVNEAMRMGNVHPVRPRTVIDAPITPSLVRTILRMTRGALLVALARAPLGDESSQHISGVLTAVDAIIDATKDTP